MKLSKFALLIIVVGTTPLSGAIADDLVISSSVQFATNTLTAESPLTRLSVIDASGGVLDDAGQGKYRVARVNSGALWTDLVVRIENVPDGFHSSEIVLRVPYYVDMLSISPAVLNTIRGDRDEIDWLRDRDPNLLTGKSLFEYYARAVYQGDYFVDTESPAEASRDGVKAVYSMLQAAKRLLVTNNVALGDKVAAGAAWLDAAVRDSLPVVRSAVTAAAAKQIVQQVREIELQDYVVLWRKIGTQKIAYHAQYCALMKRLQIDIQKSGALRQPISLYQNLGVLVGTAHAECLGNGWKSYVTEGDRNQRRELLDQQIQFLDEQRDLLVEGDSDNLVTIQTTISQLVALRETEVAANDVP